MTFEHNLSLVKGAMAMMQFFQAWGRQEEQLRTQCGTVSAIAGMLRAPLDFIADKLRGYLGLVEDLFERPGKVRAACEALMPHLTHFALATADPHKNVPIGFWMHRGCVPFISYDHFRNLFWPTLKPIVQELWAHGHQTLFYAEGNWDVHLEAFAELPDQSIVYHVDQGDIYKVREMLGGRFCLSGGLPNRLLSFGSPDEVRQYCRQLIEGVGRDGGYIMDASAIIQNDARVENIRAMTDATFQYGVYSRGHVTGAAERRAARPAPEDKRPGTFVSAVRGTASRHVYRLAARASDTTARHRRRRAVPKNLGIRRRPGGNVRLVDRTGVLARELTCCEAHPPGMKIKPVNFGLQTTAKSLHLTRHENTILPLCNPDPCAADPRLVTVGCPEAQHCHLSRR